MPPKAMQVPKVVFGVAAIGCLSWGDLTLCARRKYRSLFRDVAE